MDEDTQKQYLVGGITMTEIDCACGFSDQFECSGSFSGNPRDWPVTAAALLRGWSMREGRYFCPKCEGQKPNEWQQCPDPGCRAYHGGHTPGCKLAPPEYKAAQLDRMYEMLLYGRAVQGRLKDQTTLWQGKFHMLRQENNKLRQRNKRLATQLCILRRKQNP
jgi:hypothetical protein